MTDLSSLLTDLDWLRPLAFQLAGPDDADDALQHAWLVHRQHAGVVRQPRAWLAAVFTNFGRQRRRDAARRARHEHDRESQRPGTTLPTDELVARMELQQRVAAAVLALAEPYRSTVLLHFVDGLSTRQIADRTGEPWATVRSRLSRGVEQLRAALTRERADWRDRLALLVFGVPSRRLTRPPVVASGVAAAVAITIVAGTVGWFALMGGSEPAAAPAPPAAAGTAAVTENEPSRNARRAAASEPAPRPATPAQVASADVTFRGQLLDPQGAALAGVGVFVRGQRVGVTDDTGAFAFALPAGEHEIDTDDQHCILWAAPLRADGPNRFLATRLMRVVGEVVDDAGQPVTNARIRYHESTLGDYPHPLHDLTPRAVAEHVAPIGRFEIAVPCLDGASLSAGADGHYDWSIRFGDLDDVELVSAAQATSSVSLVVHPWLRTQRGSAPIARSEVKVRFVLRRREAVADAAWRTWVIEGLVIDAQRRPVADAVVSYPSGGAARSGLNGTFRIETGVGNLLDGRSLVAFHPEHGFAAVERPEPRWRADPNKNPYETLQLQRADRDLRGRVVDALGKPVAGRSVRVAEPPVVIDGSGGMRLFEQPAFEAGVTTDADGRFTLRDLLPREHRLAVLDPATLHWFEAGPFAADAQDVVITVTTPDLQPEWQGMVVDARDQPVAGARVMAALWVRFGGDGKAMAHSMTCVTGEDGRVVLPAQCAKGVTVTFEAPGRVMEARARGRLDGRVVQLGRVAYLRYRGLKVPPSQNQRRLQVLDAQGRPLVVEGPYLGAVRREQTHYLNGRKTAVLATSELAATLVIYTDDGGEHRDEPHRFPIRLAPGEVTVID